MHSKNSHFHLFKQRGGSLQPTNILLVLVLLGYLLHPENALAEPLPQGMDPVEYAAKVYAAAVQIFLRNKSMGFDDLG
mgnify:CR=1 FL=1